jgi:hypothetical protein
MILRRFLYLDAELTGEFLAQLEGGRFSEEELSTRGQSSRDLGGGLGTHGISARAAKGSSSEEEASRTVTQTPESEFARLAELLEENDALQFLEALDEQIWSQIRRGEILEIEADIAVSSLQKIGELAGAFGDLQKLAELAGEDLQVDDETVAGLGLMTALGSFSQKVPITARAAGAPDFKFIASLEPSKLRAEISELEGESTLIAKVQRKLKNNEKHTVFDSIPGLGAIPKSQRAEMFADLENSAEFPDVVIPAPAAIVTPIAIYR